MKNKDVINAFINHKSISTQNLSSQGNRLFSYETCIAQWDSYNNGVVLNTTKYSVTTSKHLTQLRRELEKYHIGWREINGISKGSVILF